MTLSFITPRVCTLILLLGSLASLTSQEANPSRESAVFRGSIEDWNGYVESNGDFLMDVNEDGRFDVVAGSFIPTEVAWYENPGSEGLRLGQTWKRHLFVDTKASQNEAQLMEDLDGDGLKEWVVNSWNKANPMPILTQKYI